MNTNPTAIPITRDVARKPCSELLQTAHLGSTIHNKYEKIFYKIHPFKERIKRPIIPLITPLA